MAQLNTKNFMKTAVDQTLKLIEVRTDQIHFNFFNLSNEAWKTFASPFNISPIIKFLYDFIPPMENGGYPSLIDNHTYGAEILKLVFTKSQIPQPVFNQIINSSMPVDNEIYNSFNLLCTSLNIDVDTTNIKERFIQLYSVTQKLSDFLSNKICLGIDMVLKNNKYIRARNERGEKFELFQVENIEREEVIEHFRKIISRRDDFVNKLTEYLRLKPPDPIYENSTNINLFIIYGITVTEASNDSLPLIKNAYSTKPYRTHYFSDSSEIGSFFNHLKQSVTEDREIVSQFTKQYTNNNVNNSVAVSNEQKKRFLEDQAITLINKVKNLRRQTGANTPSHSVILATLEDVRELKKLIDNFSIETGKKPRAENENGETCNATEILTTLLAFLIDKKIKYDQTVNEKRDAKKIRQDLIKLKITTLPNLTGPHDFIPWIRIVKNLAKNVDPETEIVFKNQLIESMKVEADYNECIKKISVTEIMKYVREVYVSGSTSLYLNRLNEIFTLNPGQSSKNLLHNINIVHQIIGDLQLVKLECMIDFTWIKNFEYFCIPQFKKDIYHKEKSIFLRLSEEDQIRYTKGDITVLKQNKEVTEHHLLTGDRSEEDEKTAAECVDEVLNNITRHSSNINIANFLKFFIIQTIQFKYELNDEISNAESILRDPRDQSQSSESFFSYKPQKLPAITSGEQVDHMGEDEAHEYPYHDYEDDIYESDAEDCDNNLNDPSEEDNIHENINFNEANFSKNQNEHENDHEHIKFENDKIMREIWS